VKNSSPNENSDIVFFDGVCNLCNAFVDFVIRRNSDLRFSSLQGQTAAKTLPPQLVNDLPSVVLKHGDQVFTESTAALKILVQLNGLWFLMGVFLIVPKLLRDPVYRWIGRHRYAWFGKRETCRLPTPEERSRFLD
jgi:predicted DCC family thiol-disulfide oxidoreductase YuxK